MGQAYGIQRIRSRKIHEAQRKHDDQLKYGENGDAEKETRCTPDKCKSCCKSFMAFLFSTIGLVIMVAAYSIVGGFLFQSIEEMPERESVKHGREIVKNSTEKYLEELWVITDRLNIFYKENWTAEANQVLMKYQKEVYEATMSNNWDGQPTEEMVFTKWNFAGALLYAVTAITTIGYGHVTPKTPWGMGLTIVYCLFGLPLTLMCVANLGKFFARVFRILYHTCCCGICCICCLSYKKRRTANSLRKHANQNAQEADLQTIENGSSVIVTNDPSVSLNRPRLKSNVHISKAQVWLLNVKKKFTHSLKDDVTVPVYLCLVVMAVYIIFGALLFALWDEWEYLEGAYFCFVTLTTIGFGDYVPGIVNEKGTSKEGAARLVLCSVYVFLGLALVGMCIDLMQADVLKKICWIGHKLGVMKSRNEKLKDMELKVPLKGVTIPEAESSCPNKELLPKARQNVMVHTENITSDHETPFLKFNGENGKTLPVGASTSDSGVPKNSRNGNSKLKEITDVPSGPNPTNGKVDLEDDFLCLPPPAYAEYEQHTKSSPPATPASHYDNLTNQTPLHDRLTDVSSHLDEQLYTSKQPDTKPNPPKDKTKHLKAKRNRESATSNDHALDIVREDSHFLEANEPHLSMQMENGDDGEMLLKVTQPQKS